MRYILYIAAFVMGLILEGGNIVAVLDYFITRKNIYVEWFIT